MQQRTVRILSVALALAALGGGFTASRMLTPAPPAPITSIGGDFSLNSATGLVSLAEFRGQVVPIYFGYTHCPDACPMSLAFLGQGMQKLTAAEQAQVQPLFISVDPERDTPQRLAEYVTHFHSRMLGLTGSEDEVAQVARQYGVYYQLNKAGPDDTFYGVDHTSRTYVLNRAGELIAPLEHGTSADGVAEALRAALR